MVLWFLVWLGGSCVGCPGVVLACRPGGLVVLEVVFVWWVVFVFCFGLVSLGVCVLLWVCVCGCVCWCFRGCLGWVRGCVFVSCLLFHQCGCMHVSLLRVCTECCGSPAFLVFLAGHVHYFMVSNQLLS